MLKLKRVNAIVDITVDTVDDILRLNNILQNRFFFRGQADCNWSLSTSLERMIELYHRMDCPKSPQLAEIYESKMLIEFQHKYPLYVNSNIPPIDDYIEWLAIMQHFGAKTRLLDFSKSFFVGLYMALDGSVNDVSLWGINKTFLNSRLSDWYFKETGESIGSYTAKKKFIKEKANQIICGNLKLKYSEILIIEPEYVNERIVRQQGLFLMPSDIGNGFSQCFNNIKLTEPIRQPSLSWDKFINSLADKSTNSSNPNIVIFNLTVPHKLKSDLVNLLNQMNVTAETLFPGLEGLCKSLNHIRSYSHHFE